MSTHFITPFFIDYTPTQPCTWGHERIENEVQRVLHLNVSPHRSIHMIPLQSWQASTDLKQFEELVLVCFLHMASSVWYNILQFDPNDTSGMSTSIVQRWGFILPCLIYADCLLLKSVTKLSKF